MENQTKIALMIGNSRLHWAIFAGTVIQETWDTDHFTPEVTHQFISEFNSGSPIPLILASVVPQQTALWQNYPKLRIITLDQLPLQGLYPTLGIDRALAILGAGVQLGWPMMIVDAGTALTFTGADVNRRLVGGAILPGLALQLSSLAQKTAALPLINLPENLPPRWAMDTVEAIQSGIIYTLVAGVRDFIEDWQRQFPESKIVFTGGDRTFLLTYLKTLFPALATSIIEAPHAIFWGMKEVILNFVNHE
ncbi:MAG TPA: pantothenate kinase [Kamptonema sp.]|nr:pantothenate kinase [Kamptonema sp.]